MWRNDSVKTFLRVTIISGLTLASTSILAGGFQVWEEDASGTGDYHASAAAEGPDAGSEFYNPATEVRRKEPQVSTGIAFIPLDINYNGLASGNPTPTGGVTSMTRNLVPNFHLVVPIYHHLYYGFGITVPFGLKTYYPPSSFGSVGGASTETKLIAMNYNPSFALELNKYIAIGLGFDAVGGDAVYDNLMAATTPFNNHLDGWGYGYNAGLLFQFNDDTTRIGLSYRSRVNVKASGTSIVSGFNQTIVTAQLPLPATTMFSLYQEMSPKWALMGSVFFTNWDIFDQLLLDQTALGSILVQENYLNTMNVALGVHYNATQKLMLKAGIGFDQTPTQDGYRDTRLPDNQRTALAFGLHYQFSKDWIGDLGYAHFFSPHSSINNNSEINPNDPMRSTIPPVVGIASISANVIGAQLSINL